MSTLSKLRNYLVGIVALSAGLVFCETSSFGAVLYTATWPDSELYSVDPDTGSSAYIGTMNGGVSTDLALSASEVLYSCSARDLYQVDKTNGMTTHVGSLVNTTVMVGLDFASDGVLYGVDQQTNGRLYSIDTTTGLATGLFGTGFRYSGDVAHYAGDIFYGSATVSGTSHLVKIDKSAETAVSLGEIATGSFVPALDFDASGRLIAFATDGYAYDIQDFQTSGSGTRLANVGSFGGATNVSPVPEPSSLVLWSTLGAIGLIAARRRRRST